MEKLLLSYKFFQFIHKIFFSPPAGGAGLGKIFKKGLFFFPRSHYFFQIGPYRPSPRTEHPNPRVFEPAQLQEDTNQKATKKIRLVKNTTSVNYNPPKTLRSAQLSSTKRTH